MATNVKWQNTMGREERERHLKQRGVTLWFTGLSGAGKSTLAVALERHLNSNNKATYILDGDNVRHGLCKDLGFSASDRVENIRRVGEVCSLFTDAGLIVLAAFVSPYREDRDRVRRLLPERRFIEVYVKAGEGVDVCESRDVKGLYARARRGEIPNFTGISASAPFESPQKAEITLDTSKLTVEECVLQLTELLRNERLLSCD
mmetsp:Transcript_803/g.1879  ORF Transcript_803/g.1879 Transcript_803/m.1879 type:complete len:204 (+) Transcript_803:448-1059(+)